MGAKEKVLKATTAGVILAVLGLGALFLIPLAGVFGFVYPGVLFLALGLGFLVAAGISYRLSKKWGLIKDEEEVTASLN